MGLILEVLIEDVILAHILPRLVWGDTQLQPVVPVDGRPLQAPLSRLHIDDAKEIVEVLLNHLVEGDGRHDLAHPVDYKGDKHR